MYDEAYNIKYNWEKILPDDVLQYHNLVTQQTNAPVNLQMGTVFPFVASCMGPKTRGHFLTTPSCLNLFWIVVAASGAGKSQSRKRFITDALQYILSNGCVHIEDFDILNIKYNWEKILPDDVLQYHNLVAQQTNALVDLQMGTVFPFVASCMGPKKRGHFLTTPSCLNLFWIVVAASGAGKSQSRKRFITDALQYILSNGCVHIEDFEISKFTRAGKQFNIIHILYISTNCF